MFPRVCFAVRVCALRGCCSIRMHDEDFRSHRDVYNGRAKREAPEMCWYWAWGQTRYTVHLAMWLASEDHDADIEFGVTEEGKQRIQVTLATSARPQPHMRMPSR
jgi:hypothetical protein